MKTVVSFNNDYFRTLDILDVFCDGFYNEDYKEELLSKIKIIQSGLGSDINSISYRGVSVNKIINNANNKISKESFDLLLELKN